MKKTITFFTILLLVVNIQAQEDIILLTYENTQDINFFSSIKTALKLKNI
ncbi:hypothetical protein [Chryseobacterium nematophagum]|nr:hypothetical protein [Chryseobacterium nematophagum]